MPTIVERVKHAWNAFTSRDPTMGLSGGFYGSSYRPDRKRSFVTNDGNIITMIENRIAVDVAQIDIRHVRKNENGDYKEDMTTKGNLNDLFSVSANLDQTGRAFFQDAAMSLLDEGCIALVPVDTDVNPEDGSFTIESIRVGQILEWFPQHIRVRVYNEQSGKREDIIVPKKTVAIVENPFYSIMNSPNSTLQRLVRTLRTLDVVNEANASGKMDLIIQLPYSLQSPLKQQQAEARRKQVEMQLVGSKYGIAYIDAAEHITQLNRPVENNLWKEAQDLTAMLYNQLGLTQAIFDGTATDAAMNNYYNRTIEPILAAITEEMERKFLTRTARSQGQAIIYIRDPFKLTTIAQIAEIAQTFTQNEIMSSNEIRAKVGLKPVDSDRANELINKNINKVNESGDSITDMPEEDTDSEGIEEDEDTMSDEEAASYMKDLDDLDSEIDELEEMLHSDDEDELKHYASEYYDPVKAHEYYERTKQLKGRKSTAGLNEKGKEAAAYVKEQLKNERVSKVNSAKSTKDTTIKSKSEKLKRTLEAHKTQMKSKIEQLKNRLKGMTKFDRSLHREAIQNQIKELRAENKAKRETLTKALAGEKKSLNAGFKAQRTSLKNEYDEKYLQELDKIRAESQYQKQKKVRTGGRRRR